MKYLLKLDSPVNNLQVFLRTISGAYPDIPSVIPDGVYGKATENAVTAFQKKYSLNSNGTTDYSTWNHIVDAYTEIENKTNTRMARIYPREDLNEDQFSYKYTIYIIQSMISALSEIFGNIPKVSVNGDYDADTALAVKEIQKLSGLEPDGRIDRVFWNNITMLYESLVLSQLPL